jgi:hypothetical protein
MSEKPSKRIGSVPKSASRTNFKSSLKKLQTGSTAKPPPSFVAVCYFAPLEAER